MSEKDIFADYDLTNIAAKVEERLPEAQAYFNDYLGKTYAKEVYRPFVGVDVEFLETAIGAINSEAGSIDTYLKEALGVTQDMKDAMRARLIG